MASNDSKSFGQEARERIFGNPVRNLFICAIVCILLGAAYILQPARVYSYYGYAVGGLIGFIGLLYIIMYFARRPVSGVYHSEFGLGLILLAAGVYVALGGAITGRGTINIGFSAIIRVIGVLIVLDGVMKLQYTLDVARMKFGGWWFLMLLSLIGIAVGVVTYLEYTYDVGSTLALGANPALNEAQNAFVSGMIALGALFGVNAVLDLLSMFVIMARNRRAARAARRAAVPAPAYAPADAVVVPASGDASDAPARPFM